ncbi:hypothetical protein CKM354_001201400 [Cercospora kikuchii]|uniref:Uncharacterized protein n=1 Tax=Cercospora kikuchii TaxID=84275 RepID=A0A9P3CU43_9PEZI|nr:uncharacterized protein CKM354_001201400 [Cercospora kikuchii]GIZ48971.1 hypothetical protein CKM354_001201400 [Cercospora kikuchii]
MKSSIQQALLLGGLLAGTNALKLQIGDYDEGVKVNTLSKTSNATGGTGSVAANGNLDGFGDVGIGCGINWTKNVSYGGGLTGGSADFGLGGGFNITQNQLNVSAGIGIDPANASANFVLSATKDGKFEFVFDASSETVCTNERKDGRFVVSCTSVA